MNRRRFSAADARRYVEAGGGRCPLCGSTSYVGGQIEIDAGGAEQPVSCLSCGAAWCDRYTLTGVEIETAEAAT